LALCLDINYLIIIVDKIMEIDKIIDDYEKEKLIMTELEKEAEIEAEIEAENENINH
jgi:hypothetical protein